MRVTVRRPGQSAQPVIRVQKRPDDGFVKRSAKRPSKRSQATAVESAVPCGAPTGDAEDIVSKSAPPWIGLEQPFQRGRLPLRYFVVNAPSAARRQRSETAKVHLWRRRLFHLGPGLPDPSVGSPNRLRMVCEPPQPTIDELAVLTGHVLGSILRTVISTALVVLVAVAIGFRPTTNPL